MTSPESPNPIAALADVERKLELANAIENPLVRHFLREELWEQYDELQGEIEEAGLPPEHP